MAFSKETLKAMATDLKALQERSAALVEQFVSHGFQNEKAKEFAKHGVARRLGTMARCASKVFDILPPEKSDPPEADARSDAEIHIQAFLFNAVGALDNLAWICVSERGIKKPSGKALPPSQIGLGPGNSIVRDSLGAGLQKTLAEMDEWFDYLEDYRHALAHRIPLYVIPFTLEGAKADTYKALEIEKDVAIKAHDFDKVAKAEAQQRALVVFFPLIMHSIGEGARRMIFHPQLLSDLKQIATLASAVLDEFPAGA